MSWLRDLAADVRFAVRLHRRAPTFTLVVLASLALGIGANAAIVSLTDALLFRPLPVRQPERLVLVSALFAALALVLTCTGIYGVLSYAVTARRRELGIRLALGARAGSVLWLVARRSGLLLAGGLAAGVPAAIGAARLTRGVLYRVSPTDLRALTAALLAVIVIAALATLGPARAAVRVDPMVALRSE